MLTQDDKAGIYLTVIVHLVILIVLLLAQIGYSLRGGESFVIDFSKTEEIDRQDESEKTENATSEGVDEAIAAKVDKMLAGISGIDFKNVSTSRNGGALKDDRGTDAEKLYEDAKRLANELKAGHDIDEPDDNYAAPSTEKPKETAAETPYSGPSVLSWHLDGRKASHLPIPAYRCYGGGMVTVVIGVNNAGRVVDARILEDVSSKDKCLRDFAIRAARMSRFSSSPTAPAKQTGDIVYQFIAQ